MILSRLGGSRHEAKLRAVIEHYTDVPVLGAMHEDPRLAIAERHIGLTPTNEDGTVQTRAGCVVPFGTAELGQRWVARPRIPRGQEGAQK